MKKENLQLEEAKDYLRLARTYFKIAKCRGDQKEYLRGVIDANYNSAELCVKGLLKLKMDNIPSTHRGVVLKFGQLYVKTGMVAKELGRALNKALLLRNLARYEQRAEITEIDAKEIKKLNKQMVDILKEAIKSYGTRSRKFK